MIIKHRNGKKAMVLLNTVNENIVSGQTWYPLPSVNEDLTHKGKGFEEFDIVSVYQPNVAQNYAKKHWSKAKRIWKRTKSVYPMWFEHIVNGAIWQFTALGEAKLIVKTNYCASSVGYTSTVMIPHTDTDLWKQVPEPKPELEFTYPMWFKNKPSGSIWKFTALNEAECLYKGSSHWKAGSKTRSQVAHTCSTWTQITEPKELSLEEVLATIFSSLLNPNNTHYRSFVVLCVQPTCCKTDSVKGAQW